MDVRQIKTDAFPGPELGKVRKMCGNHMRDTRIPAGRLMISH